MRLIQQKTKKTIGNLVCRRAMTQHQHEEQQQHQQSQLNEWQLIYIS